MKTSRLYHFRITATAAAGECRSDDYTIMTGPIANGLQKPTVTTSNASALAGGFLVTGQHATNAGMSSAQAYILDADGDYVWWMAVTNDVSGARMSYDGTHMWINSVNVPSGTARVHRVGMDGLTDEDLSSQFTGQSHQLTVLPDETIAFYAYGSNGCYDIKERAPNGTVRTIVNAQVALRTTGDCHLNNIQYSQPDDTLVFSDLNHNQVAKVKRSDGSTVWILNGTTATLTGATWIGGEHGLHLVDLTHILLFNNNINGTGGSNALDFLLDPTARTVARIWSYTASPAINVQIMGDVQRLPNGNTVIGYSTKGALHEVSSSGTVLQTLAVARGRDVRLHRKARDAVRSAAQVTAPSPRDQPGGQASGRPASTCRWTWNTVWPAAGPAFITTRKPSAARPLSFARLAATTIRRPYSAASSGGRVGQRRRRAGSGPPARAAAPWARCP